MITDITKLLFLFLILRKCRGDHLPPSDYSLLFPTEPNSAVARIDNPGIPGKTTELTMSMWVYQVYKSEKPDFNTLISYAVNSTDDAFTFSSHGNIWYFEMQRTQYAPVRNIVKINEWMHYIVTWQSRDGLVQFYVNGELVHSQLHDAVKGLTWPEDDGVLVLGQDQDAVGGGFQPHQSFRGELTEVNIWNKRLTYDEAVKVYNSQYEGNIIAWSRAVWTLDGKIAVVKSSDKHAH